MCYRDWSSDVCSSDLAVFPLLSLAALGWLAYELFNPYPAAPVSYAIPTVGIWLLLGIVILGAMAARGKEEWLTKAGESAFEIVRSEERRVGRGGRVGL